ncbi:MAG TPA: branched-chain amino acid ABC transporter permease [Dehalococcoidia bacterium]|nr:branched-chain amino acid ABC transporter permease [Dehalococcoidia bacterium]
MQFKRLAALVLCVLAVAVAGYGLIWTAASAQEPESQGEAFRGTLVFEDEPVAGVKITVETEDGHLIEVASSAEDGTWRVELPGPGSYRAIIDTDTLPGGIALRRPDRQTLELAVTVGRTRTLLFALGDPPPPGPNAFEKLAQASLNGVKLGLIIAMCAVGLSLIFGTTKLINFAHGELVTFGAIVAWYLTSDEIEIPLIAGAVLTVMIAGSLGGGLEIGVLRPLRARGLGQFQFVLMTIGLSLLGRHIMLMFFGPDPARYRDFALQSEWDWGPLAITPRDLTIMILAATALVATALIIQRTRIGKAMRAVSDDVDLAESSGIDVDRVTLFVWVLGAGLAALGGIFLGSVESIDWFMGFRLLLLMFAAVVLGGLGSAYGAMAGGLLIGLATEVSAVWFSSEIKAVFALGALIIALLVRPQGLLGRKERVG